MVKLLVLLSALAVAVQAQVQSPNYQFNVTSPSPNSPYVASQMLPCVYHIAANTTSDNLKLSILLVGTNSSQEMIASADISQGFSFEKQIPGGKVYEHQHNYPIPSNTTAGAYQVVFHDAVSQTNVSIPITISAAPATPSRTPLPSGDANSASPSSLPGSIYKPNSASAGTEISKSLLVASALLAFVQL